MQVSFQEAIRQALFQEMNRDPRVFVYGIGTPTRDMMFGTVDGLLDQFGPKRVIDTPVAEEAMLGLGLGAAVGGLRPVHCHIRADFMALGMNQLLNMISPYFFLSNGKTPVPLTMRVVVGRGWGQGAQHSKSLQAMFAHIPGLKVVVPVTPADAKGLLAAAIRDPNPVIFLEHRWLYWQEGEVPEGEYVSKIETVPTADVEGNALTIVATGWNAVEAKKARDIVEAVHGVKCALFVPRLISADLDFYHVIESFKKSHRLLVVDGDWGHIGFGAEVVAKVAEKIPRNNLVGGEPPSFMRMSWPNTHVPTERSLEEDFYSDTLSIVRTIEYMRGIEPTKAAPVDASDIYSHTNRFKGPF
jgi:pyruvate/2-oxoglutarate/acetoin dehydrogenase E1 component